MQLSINFTWNPLLKRWLLTAKNIPDGNFQEKNYPFTTSFLLGSRREGLRSYRNKITATLRHADPQNLNLFMFKLKTQVSTTLHLSLKDQLKTWKTRFKYKCSINSINAAKSTMVIIYKFISITQYQLKQASLSGRSTTLE